MRWGGRLPWAAACVMIAAYAVLSHYCNSMSGASELGALLALTPLTVFALVMCWRSMPPVAAAALTLLLCGLLYTLWPVFKTHYSMFYLVQESSVYGLLGLTFSRSLLSGR